MHEFARNIPQPRDGVALSFWTWIFSVFQWYLDYLGVL